MRTTWTFHTAGELVFGPGAVSQLGARVARLDVSRLLIVTYEHLVRAGLVDQVLAPLNAAGIQSHVFSGGEPEPSFDAVGQALAAARQARPHGVLGLGGGSNLDLAKIVAVLLTHGGSVTDYVGEDRVPGPVLPLVGIATTSGTGSEVTAASVLTDRAQALKVGVLSNYLRPRLAIVDPRLTLTCPPQVTADSGIDALTHAIEAFTAVDNASFPLPEGEVTLYQGRHPLGDCLAEKAIALVGRHLRRAVAHGDDLEAREGMALAATIAGMAFSNVGVAAVHALEYPLGGAVHCSHGSGNGLLLPYVMRFNLPARTREMARIAALLGVDTRGLDDLGAAEAAIAAVEELKREIGIPARLRDLGVSREQLAQFAAKAITIQRILRVNPRYPTVADLEQILESAY